MKKIILLAILLIGLFLTNPSYEKHKAEINETFKADHPLVGKIGGGKLLSGLTDYNNYFLCSTTELDNQQVSFGIMGIVFVSNLDEL